MACAEKIGLSLFVLYAISHTLFSPAIRYQLLFPAISYKPYAIRY